MSLRERELTGVAPRKRKMRHSTINITDPISLDIALYKAIRAAISHTEFCHKRALNSTSSMGAGLPEWKKKKMGEQIAAPPYVVGLFVNSLRRELNGLKSALTNVEGAHSFLDSLVQPRNWSAHGDTAEKLITPDTRYVFERTIPLDKDRYNNWYINYPKIVDMCNGTFMQTNPAATTISDDPLEENILQGLETLSVIASKVSSMNALIPEAQKELVMLGQIADNQHKEIYS